MEASARDASEDGNVIMDRDALLFIATAVAWAIATIRSAGTLWSRPLRLGTVNRMLGVALVDQQHLLELLRQQTAHLEN